jgi:hypothetical protein
LPIEYSIDLERGMLRIVARGVVSIDESMQVAREGFTDPDYRPGMPILMDNRLRKEAPSTTDVRSMVQSTKRSPHIPKGTRCAVVVESDIHFGLTRMFSTMGDQGPLVTRGFRDVESAEAWLLSGSSPEGAG